MSTRHKCPSPECGKGRTLSLYVDAETGEPLGGVVGRCNRVDSCGYHYTPKQYFSDNKIEPHRNISRPVRRRVTPETSYIDTEVFKKSLAGYNANHFTHYIKSLLGDAVASKLIASYFIGTSKKWPGSTVFWQIDLQGKIRTGKIMLYDKLTGKRVKEPFNHITWVQTLLKLQPFELKQCFFGEHLLRDVKKPVAIVESEKTAIIASAYLPQFTWLGCGNKNGLNDEKCKKLKNHQVILYPDLGSFDAWSKIANKYGFKISDLLERRASDSDKKNGLDLADFLTKYPPPLVAESTTS